MKYRVLCAFRNRRVLTVSFASALQKEVLPPGASLSMSFFDDGSTDGTAEALVEAGIQVHIVRGDGSAYWNGAMTGLIKTAMEGTDDAVILANDDVSLFPGALTRSLTLFEELNSERPTALVGAFKDQGGATTYSGFRRKNRLRPLALDTIEPGAQPIPCDTFNGNFVIIPLSSCREVGGLDGSFCHAYGDVDLGLRLAAAGVRLLIAPHHLGECSRGPSFRHRLANLNLSKRFALAFGPLRSPKDYFMFMWKYARPLAPALFVKEVANRLLMVITA